jgi:hypothetical protein
MYHYQEYESSHLTRISERYTVDLMKRRKPKSERKEAIILIRLTDGQKEILMSAAKKAGLDLSGWVRSLALREAANSDARP